MQEHRYSIPSPIANDKTALELIRVWAAQGQLHLSVARESIQEDPFGWGITVVDLLKHAAIAYEQATGKPRSEVLELVKEGFDAEWGSPTTHRIGEITIV